MPQFDLNDIYGCAHRVQKSDKYYKVEITTEIKFTNHRDKTVSAWVTCEVWAFALDSAYIKHDYGNGHYIYQVPDEHSIKGGCMQFRVDAYKIQDQCLFSMTAKLAKLMAIIDLAEINYDKVTHIDKIDYSKQLTYGNLISIAKTLHDNAQNARRAMLFGTFLYEKIRRYKKVMAHMTEFKSKLDVVNYAKGMPEDEYQSALRAVWAIKKFEKQDHITNNLINKIIQL